MTSSILSQPADTADCAQALWIADWSISFTCAPSTTSNAYHCFVLDNPPITSTLRTSESHKSVHPLLEAMLSNVKLIWFQHWVCSRLYIFWNFVLCRRSRGVKIVIFINSPKPKNSGMGSTAHPGIGCSIYVCSTIAGNYGVQEYYMPDFT